MKAVIYDANGDQWKPVRGYSWVVILGAFSWLLLVIVIGEVHDKHKPKPKIDEPASTWVTSSGSLTLTLPQPRAAGFKTKPPVIKPPIDHPPLKVVLGAYTYNVRFTTKKYLRANECYAYTNLDTQEIWLNGEMGHHELRENMLHELMHAALQAHRAEYGSMAFSSAYLNDENTFVTPLAPDLLDAFRDNPELAKWLLRD